MPPITLRATASVAHRIGLDGLVTGASFTMLATPTKLQLAGSSGTGGLQKALDVEPHPQTNKKIDCIRGWSPHGGYWFDDGSLYKGPWHGFPEILR